MTKKCFYDWAAEEAKRLGIAEDSITIPAIIATAAAAVLGKMQDRFTVDRVEEVLRVALYDYYNHEDPARRRDFVRGVHAFLDALREGRLDLSDLWHHAYESLFVPMDTVQVMRQLAAFVMQLTTDFEAFTEDEGAFIPHTDVHLPPA
ncbi:MAG: hypothetical protein NZ742_12510 [Acidobacteria bacterium]|nr:hypothetical protein [Acidobacteriota bacterium]MDW7985497.1 hypothetical protein [Acidobacteriota bacterium]